MIKSLISFFLLAAIQLLSNTTSGQTRLSGVVIDLETKKPVPFATVYNTNSKTGMYTTPRGLFDIGINNGDSILISCVGYKSEKFSTGKLISSVFDTIYLILETKVLSEIIVSPVNWSRYKSKEIGLAAKKSNWHLGGSTGIEYAVLVRSEKKYSDAYISELIYKIKKLDNDSVVTRLHLYTVKPDGTPGIELLDSNYFEIITGQLDKLLFFNVFPAKIRLPEEGVFVGIEWLGIYNNNNSILNERIRGSSLGFNDKLKNVVTFERSRNGEWLKADIRNFYLNTPMEKQAFSENAPNASFGMTIKVHK